MAGPVAEILAAFPTLGTAGPAPAAELDLDLAGFTGLADAGHTGSGVVVAVVDSGLDLDHPAFDRRVVSGWEFIDNDGPPRDGHGTHVAVADRAVVVVAAGNEAQYEELFRAGVPGVVVVATDSSGNLAPFTNIRDTRAVAALGVGIVSTASDHPTTLFPGGTVGYASLSGTSMAAPFVSAEAALLIQAGLTPAEVRATIPATAHNPSGNPRLGAGIVDGAAAVESVQVEDVTSSNATAPTDEPTAAPEDSDDDATRDVPRDAPRNVRWDTIGLGAVLLMILIGIGIGTVGRRKE